MRQPDDQPTPGAAAVELSVRADAGGDAAAPDTDDDRVGLVTGLRQENKRLRRGLVALLAVAAVVGASLGVYFGAFHQQDGMTVEQSTDTEFSASYAHQGERIHVRLTNTPAGAPNVLEWTFSFNGHDRLIDYRLDMEGRTLLLDGHDLVLTKGEKQALAALRADLASFVFESSGLEGQASLHAGLLERVADYLSQAPKGHPIPRHLFDMGSGGYVAGGDHADAEDQPHREAAGGAAPASATRRGAGGRARGRAQAWEQDDGVKCLRWGSTQQARFDGRGGDNWSWWHVVGTDSVCTGRCGAKCNIFDREAFQDCMDHDLCVTHFGGSVLFDSADCGDEFNHAADDYIASYGWFC